MIRTLLKNQKDKRLLEKREKELHDELLIVHNRIEEWFFGYYFALELPEDFNSILYELLEKEYVLAQELYRDSAIKLTFKDVAYLTSTQKVEWWIMWGLSIYR